MKTALSLFILWCLTFAPVGGIAWWASGDWHEALQIAVFFPVVLVTGLAWLMCLFMTIWKGFIE